MSDKELTETTLKEQLFLERAQHQQDNVLSSKKIGDLQTELSKAKQENKDLKQDNEDWVKAYKSEVDTVFKLMGELKEARAVIEKVREMLKQYKCYCARGNVCMSCQALDLLTQKEAEASSSHQQEETN